jgi:hypothetical protein
MSTINGCGTMHYDWSHLQDGTAQATKWIVLFFFPIVPLKREHLRVADTRTLGGAYYIYGRVPMRAYGIARTYLKAYLLVPVILVVPPAILFLGAMQALKYLNLDFHGPWPAGVICVTCLVYWGVALSLILDRSHGRKKTS